MPPQRSQRKSRGAVATDNASYSGLQYGTRKSLRAVAKMTASKDEPVAEIPHSHAVVTDVMDEDKALAFEEPRPKKNKKAIDSVLQYGARRSVRNVARMTASGSGPVSELPCPPAAVDADMDLDYEEAPAPKKNMKGTTKSARKSASVPVAKATTKSTKNKRGAAQMREENEEGSHENDEHPVEVQQRLMTPIPLDATIQSSRGTKRRRPEPYVDLISPRKKSKTASGSASSAMTPTSTGANPASLDVRLESPLQRVQTTLSAKAKRSLPDLETEYPRKKLKIGPTAASASAKELLIDIEIDSPVKRVFGGNSPLTSLTPSPSTTPLELESEQPEPSSFSHTAVPVIRPQPAIPLPAMIKTFVDGLQTPSSPSEAQFDRASTANQSALHTPEPSSRGLSPAPVSTSLGSPLSTIVLSPRPDIPDHLPSFGPHLRAITVDSPAFPLIEPAESQEVADSPVLHTVDGEVPDIVSEVAPADVLESTERRSVEKPDDEAPAAAAPSLREYALSLQASIHAGASQDVAAKASSSPKKADKPVKARKSHVVKGESAGLFDSLTVLVTGKRRSTAPKRFVMEFGGGALDEEAMEDLELEEVDEVPATKQSKGKAVAKKADKKAKSSTPPRPPSPPIIQNALPPEMAAESSLTDPEDRIERQAQPGKCLAANLRGQGKRLCKACVQRQTWDECRWKGFREFDFDMNAGKVVGGPYFSSSEQDDAELVWPAKWNIEMDMGHIERTKSVVAKALLPVMRTELKHIQQPNSLRRRRETECRATCDTCMTSIFSGSWHCRECGRDLCLDCYEALCAISYLPNARPQLKGKTLTDIPQEDRHMIRCHTENKSVHYPQDFIPCTRFKREELEQVIREMESLAEREGSPDPSAGEPPSLDSSTSSEGFSILESPPVASSDFPVTSAKTSPQSEPVTSPLLDVVEIHSPPAGPSTSSFSFIPPVDPSGVDSHPVRYFEDANLGEAEFRSLWAHGEPLVVTGLMPKAKINWSPAYFIRNYGEEECLIVDCDTQGTQATTVGKFFKLLGNRKDGESVQKLKDWPPTADFRETFPELYQDFSNMVPIPNYTRRDGVLNIASHFPTNAIAPDIGPKMYNATESSELPGRFGSTRLHMDMADAINILLYAAPREDKTEGVAAWDIYRAEDAEAIRAFLKEEFPAPEVLDPIHSQLYYLDSDLRRKLFERYQVKSWRIYQRAGEAVFIPAGCAHQVCNLADAIKVAVDFVSPENISRCIKLTQEFRAQNKAKAWKEDVLALRSMMWYSWVSCSRLQAKMEGRDLASVPISTA